VPPRVSNRASNGKTSSPWVLRAFSIWTLEARALRHGVVARPAQAERADEQVRAQTSVFRNGAPQSMKMGSVRSPWRYEQMRSGARRGKEWDESAEPAIALNPLSRILKLRYRRACPGELKS